MIQKQSLVLLLAFGSFGLVGCKDSLLDRALIFSTHTTLGLEVSVNPAESGQPGKLIIGYKRTEGVINPVYHSQGIKTPEDEKTVTKQDNSGITTTVEAKGQRPRYRKEAYSVIAKFTGDTGGRADKLVEGSMSVAQWFATGEAAKTLAEQPGIAGAVSGSSDIAKAAAGETSNLTRFRGKKRTSVFSLLTEMYKLLGELSRDASDPALRIQADEIKASLDNARVLDEIDYGDFDRYDYDEGQKRLSIVAITSVPPRFLKATSYRQELAGSIDDMKKALGEPALKESGKAVTPEQRLKLIEEMLRQQKKLDELDNALLGDNAILNMMQYFLGN